MSELKTLIQNSGGLKSLDQLLKTVADALNISVGQLQSNLPNYLEQIGRYGLIENIVGGIWISLFIGGLISFAISISLFMAHDFVKFKIKSKHFLIAGFVPTSAIFIFNLTQQVLLYWASPQIYAIKYLKDLLGI